MRCSAFRSSEGRKAGLHSRADHLSAGDPSAAQDSLHWYQLRRASHRDWRDPTLKPPVFARFSNSQVGHLGVIPLPPESEKLDYEGEIAVIIGKAGRRIPADRVWAHIAGYAPYNDASVRDWQGHTQQWTPGKNFLHTGGFGPWMSTRDEFVDNPELHLCTRLNGVEVQRATSRQMIFRLPRSLLIAPRLPSSSRAM